MSRTLYATVSIPLPANEIEAAGLLTTLAPHWADFTRAVEGLSVPYTQELVSRTNRPERKATNGNGDAA